MTPSNNGNGCGMKWEEWGRAIKERTDRIPHLEKKIDGLDKRLQACQVHSAGALASIRARVSAISAAIAAAVALITSWIAKQL